jgi:acetyl-CoA carboxylase biotin carboxyl carrier protein
MDLTTLGGIAEIMEKYNLSHVEAQVEGEKVKLDRAVPGLAPSSGASPAFIPVAPPAAPSAQAAGAQEPLAPATPAAPAPSPAATPASDDADDVFNVEAPMVGVFYAAPAPGADPFVRVGSKVKKGDTLCIVEAMKCMNEVQSEVDGTVVDICASDGELVEYGRCLMRIS